MTVTDSDFAVGAQIDQCNQIVPVGNSGCDDAGKNVGTDKAPKTTRETNGAGRGQRPAQLLWMESLYPEMRRDKRHMGQWLNAEP